MNTDGFTNDEIQFLKKVPDILGECGNYGYECATYLYNTNMDVDLTVDEFRARFDDFMAPKAVRKHVESKPIENEFVKKFLANHEIATGTPIREILEAYDAFKDEENRKLISEIFEKTLPTIKLFESFNIPDRFNILFRNWFRYL